MTDQTIDEFLTHAEERIDTSAKGLPFDQAQGKLVIAWLRARQARAAEVRNHLEGSSMTFSDTDLGIISNALWVAAERFHECAAELQKNHGSTVVPTRLAEQFGRQELDARRLHDRIATDTGIAS